tara:strand:+ start:309 stop:1097 length:789 start_codon:yes stop_codon:yes gene_type:complete
MRLNVPTELRLSDVYENNPFTLFEMENFLDQKLYESLRKEFPDRSYFTKCYDKGNKICLDNNDPKFFKFIEQSKTWKLFYQTFNSEANIKKFFHLLLPDLKRIPQRKKIKNIKLFNQWNLDYKSKVYNKILNLIGTKFVKVKFQFSRIQNNCFIPPHCETKNKICALLIYFPDKNMSKFDKNRLGTNFYKKSKDNLDVWDSEIMDESETINFYKNYQRFYYSKFTENKLVGLIKSDNSWHDVTKLDNLKEDRKSFNIFFFLA